MSIGSINDYTEAEMLAVAAKLQERLRQLTLPEFSFDSWWFWDGNVVLHISPDDTFALLYEYTVAALRSVVGSDRTTGSTNGSFIAHTGLAYAKTHDQEHEINQQLAARPIKPATFRATHMPLIKTYPANGHWEWEVVKDVIIG